MVSMNPMALLNGGMNPMALLNQMVPGPGGMRHAGGGHEHVEAYFRKLADGPCEDIPKAVKAVVLAVMKEYMDKVMSDHGYVTEAAAEEYCGYDKQAHRAFKETIEVLRELPSSQVAAAIDEHFDGLTSGERRVVSALANMPSKRKMAENIGMNKEHFMELKHAAEAKLKHKK